MHSKHSHPLITTVRKALLQLGVTSTSRMLAGVSGGIDSMVLLHSLKSLNLSVAAAHVNFTLRANDSEEDALLVRKWCSENDVPYFEHRVDTREFAREHKLNIQSAARRIRYDWWNKLVSDHAFEFFATAHHRDDAIETFFINLFRGTGMKGLKSIPMKRDYFIRPLLRVSKSDIENYAAHYHVPFRHDQSNESDDYQRNRIRHHLIPLLKEFMPDPLAAMDQSLHRIRTEWDAWENGFLLWLSGSVIEKDGNYVVKSSEIEHAFLLRWLEEKGFPWQLAYDYVKADINETGKILETSDYQLSRTNDGFYLGTIESFKNMQIDQPGIYVIGDDAFSIESMSLDSFPVDNDPCTEYIDASIVHWPLELRRVSPGDHFQPIGMNGKTKKLQDFLVDLKLEHFEKKEIKVLVSGENIIWVVGKRLDERYKIKPGTKNVLKLVYKRGAINAI